MLDTIVDDSRLSIARATCILNSAAGSARQARGKLANLFAQMRAEVHIVDVSDNSDAGAIASKAVAENSKLVLAAGGDGTINAVAAALIGTGAWCSASCHSAHSITLPRI